MTIIRNNWKKNRRHEFKKKKKKGISWQSSGWLLLHAFSVKGKDSIPHQGMWPKEKKKK